MIRCYEKSSNNNRKAYSKADHVKTHVEYLRDILVKHQMSEIKVFDVDVLEETIKATGSETKSYNNFLSRLMHSVQGRKLFEDIGIFYYPYISYKGCRVYKIKTDV